jgi:hypothetical protein
MRILVSIIFFSASLLLSNWLGGLTSADTSAMAEPVKINQPEMPVMSQSPATLSATKVISVTATPSGTNADWWYTNLDLSNVYQLGNLSGQPQVWIGFSWQSDVYLALPEGAYVMT